MIQLARYPRSFDSRRFPRDTIAAATSSSAVKIGDGVVAVGNAGGAGGTPRYAAGSVIGTNWSITALDAANGSSEQLSGLIKTNAAVISGDFYGWNLGLDAGGFGGLLIATAVITVPAARAM